MSHKLAFIGFGGMGDWHLNRIIRPDVPDVTVKGVYDISEERQAYAKDQGLMVYKTAEELLADPEIDIVTIAVPNNFHKDYAIACLRAGKNVICEKPVTMNAAELEEIIRVRNETGKLFSVHQNRRWDRDFCMIKKILEDQTIGDPYFIESRILGSRRSMHGWRGHSVNGGGMVYDWGVHVIDQALDMIDSRVVSVDAHLFNVFSDDVDDNCKIMLRFENGVSYDIEIATNCFINQPRWHVSGKEGTVVIDDWECNGKITTLNTAEEMEWASEIVYTAAGPTRMMAPRPKQTMKELPLPDIHPNWSEYYWNILDVLDNGADLIVKPEQSLRVMKTVDAVFESERLKKGIACDI